MDSGPVSTFQVHEYLKPKVSFIYFDRAAFDELLHS